MSYVLGVSGVASCTSVDPELFFPGSKTGIEINLKIVKPICNRCPVFTACEQYAKRYPELQGIWAGRYRDGVGYRTVNSMRYGA